MSALREALRRAEAQVRRESGREEERERSAIDARPDPKPAGEARDGRSEVTAARAVQALALEPLHEVAANAAEKEPSSESARAIAPASSEGARAIDRRRPFVFAIALLAAVTAATGAYYLHQFRTVAARPAGNPVPVAADKAEPAPRIPPRDDALAAWPEEAGVSSRARIDIDDRAHRTGQRSPNAPASPQAKPVAVSHEMSATVSPAARQVARIHPQVEAGYAALRSGDLEAARVAYRRVLDEEPVNRDALLGMAAVERYARRDAQAAAHLESMQRAHPGDAHAVAGLIALAAERADPARAESRLKVLLASNPDSPSLHLLLGNQYARQGRWAEAQQAYLQAQEGDPGNPDLAFNLAVSYDRLQEPARARDLYSQALTLAGARAATFAPEAALRRLQELGD